MEKEKTNETGLLKGRFRGLSGNTLKWIAMIAMFIDHYAHIYINPYLHREAYMLLRGIGRLAFPIFCFLLVEGVMHTKNFRRYVIRMAAAMLITEIPFDLAMYGVPFYWGYQSVLQTLLIGLIGVGCFRWCVNRQLPIYALMVMFTTLMVAFFSSCDYGARGVALIFAFYLLQYAPVKRAIVFALWCILMGNLEMWAVFAIIPIALYNGKRGRGGKAFQYFGYLFYPLHLLLLWLGTLF